MKKLIIIIFCLFTLASQAQIGRPQTIYEEPTINAMKSYFGNATRIHVVATNEDYVVCSDCTVDESEIYQGAAGRKWKKLKVGLDESDIKTPLLASFAALRALTNINSDATFIYKVSEDDRYGDFKYRPDDVSTPDDSAIYIRNAQGKLFERVITDGRINARWFGAKGDGTTDDTYNLQRWIDWCIKNNRIKLFLPKGRYKISNGLVAWKDADNNGFPEFFSLDIEGEANSYGFNGATAASVIVASHTDNFAINFQFGKGVRVNNIASVGENNLGSLTRSQVYSGDRSLFVVNGCRENFASPYAGIVIDGFHASTSAGNRYPRMEKYYNVLVNTGTTGSTDIIIKNCFIQNFVAGVICSPNGYSQNAEVIKIEDCWIDHCRDAIVNAQSQTRQNEVKNLKVWGGVHTIFNCAGYGQGNGVMPNVNGVNIAGYNYQLLRLLGGWTNASLENIYAELLYRLGEWGTSPNGLPVAISNSYFDIPTGDHYTSANFFSNQALVTGSTIRMYNNRTGFFTGNANNSTFINCQLPGPMIPYRDLLVQPSANKIIDRTKYINCTSYGLPVIGTYGRVESDLTEHSNRLGFYQQSIYGVKSAIITPSIFGEQVNPSNRQPIPLTYKYGLSGELQNAIYSAGEGGRTVKFLPNTGGAYFVSADASRYYINDIIAQSGITATIDGESGISSTVLGVVESISNDTIYLTSVTNINPSSTDKSGVTLIAYQQSEFQEPFVGTITSGSNVITDVRFHMRLRNIKPYTAIQHPAFPFFTRITAVDYVAKTVTLSKTALSSDANGVVELTRLSGSGQASQEPNAINYGSYPLFDSAFSLILKGSFITNTGSDTSILGWSCARTGFLGTTKPPVFVAAYKYNAPAGTGSNTDSVVVTNNGELKKVGNVARTDINNEFASAQTVHANFLVEGQIYSIGADAALLLRDRTTNRYGFHYRDNDTTYFGGQNSSGAYQWPIKFHHNAPVSSFVMNASGALRLGAYTAGVAIFDASGNITSGSVPTSNIDTASIHSPIWTALNARELTSNKSTNTSLGSSDVLYPSQKAVKEYVDAANSLNTKYTDSATMLSAYQTALNARLNKTDTANTARRNANNNFSVSQYINGDPVVTKKYYDSVDARIGNRVSMIGSSITLGNGVHSSSLEYRGNADPLNWAHILSDGKIYYHINAGVGGNTTAQMLARLQTDIITPGTDWCIVEGGINDALQNISFATFKANIISLVSQLRAVGTKVALANIVPSTDATAKTLIPKFNAFLAYYAYRNQIPLIDFYGKLAATDGTGGQLTALTSGDGTHPNSAGGKVMGQAVYDCLNTVMGNWSPYIAIVQTNSQNLFPNGLNVDANTDGTGDNYTKSGTGTATIVTGDANITGNWQRLVVTDGTASTMYQATTTGFSVGDRMAFSCKIKAAPTSSSKVNVYLTFAGPFTSHYLVKDVDVSIDRHTVYYEFTVPASTTGIRAFISSSTGGTNADVQFAQVTLTNLTTLGIP